MSCASRRSLNAQRLPPEVRLSAQHPAIRDGVDVACVVGMTAKRFVYVLTTGEGIPRYYVGITSDVAQRLVWHNEGHCTHTAKYRPWCAHVGIEFSDEAHATKFERYLKSGSGRAFARRHFD